MKLNKQILIKSFISTTLLFSIIIIENNNVNAIIKNDNKPKITYIYTQKEIINKNIKTENYFISKKTEQYLKNNKDDKDNKDNKDLSLIHI